MSLSRSHVLTVTDLKLPEAILLSHPNEIGDKQSKMFSEQRRVSRLRTLSPD